MSALYEIDSNLCQLLDDRMIVDEETGEILFDEENLEELILSREEKLENVALYIKNLLSDAEQIKIEEENLKARKNAKKKKAEKLKSYLSKSMELFGDTKFETPKVSLSFRKSTSIEVAPNADLPKEFIKVKTEESPDKSALKNAILKQGMTFDGVELVTNKNLQIK